MSRHFRNGMLILLVLGWAAGELQAQTPGPLCGGVPCVFQYRGSLAPGVADSPTGAWVKELELADVDGDGWLDIYMMQKQPLVPQGGENVVQEGDNLDLLYRNQPSFVFAIDGDTAAEPNRLEGYFLLETTATAFGDPFPTTRGYDAEILDMDGDPENNLDIVRIDTVGSLKILWGDGTGLFHDHTDLFTSPTLDPNKDCELNFGSLTPEPPLKGGNYDDVDVADLDGDGDFDLLVANWQDCGTNLLFRNLAAQGSPRQFEWVNVPNLGSQFTHSVSLGLVNNDPWVDALLSNGGPPLLLLGSGPFTFQTPVPFTQLASETLVPVADIVGDLPGDAVPDDVPDLNGDGLADVVLASFNQMNVFFNNGSSTNPYPNRTLCNFNCISSGNYDARYADLDGDGQMEMVTVSITVGDSSNQPGNPSQPFVDPTDMKVYRVAGAGGTSFEDVTDEFLIASTFTGHQGGIGVDLGDLDQDGDLDMVLGGAQDLSTPRGAVHFYENRTVGRLANRTVASGAYLFEVLDTFTGASGATITGTAQVTVEAGNEVILTDGFVAAPGSGGQFIARIRP